jgi:hypothetical protein
MSGPGSRAAKILGDSLALDHDLTLSREAARVQIRAALEIEPSQELAARRLGVSRRALVRWLAEHPDLAPARRTID